MIGLAIGAGALLGYAFYRRARWHHAMAYGYGHGCHGGWHGGHHHGWHGGGPGGWGWRGHFARRAWFYGAMEALDLSPAQEKLVRTEFAAARDLLRNFKPELRETRADVARAVSGATFDRAAIDAAFARHDKAFGELRAQIAGSLERIHAALDDRQRERLAEMLDRGRGWRGARPDGGPYRV